VPNLRVGHGLLAARAGLLATAWEEMPVRVEGDLDAGVAHLIANVGGGFALGDQLAGEEVSQVMVACACHTGFFRDRLPNLEVEFVRIYEAISPGKMKAPSGLPTFRSANIHHALGRSDAAQ
jgi:hypothetical protein